MTKQLNKKGTSLVELIAVIIIMGIIAGIAIPTTIAVINRQKRNAAKSSAQNVYSAAQTALLEAATGETVDGVEADEREDIAIYKTTVSALVENGELEKNPFSTDVEFVLWTDGAKKNKVEPTGESFVVNTITLYWNADCNEFSLHC